MLIVYLVLILTNVLYAHQHSLSVRVGVVNHVPLPVLLVTLPTVAHVYLVMGRHILIIMYVFPVEPIAWIV